MFTYVFADALVQCGGTAAGTGRCAGRFKEICPRCWSSSRAPDQLEGPSRPGAGRWSAWTSCPAQRPAQNTRDAGRGRNGMHNNVAVTDPAKLAQEFTQPHFYTPPAKKSWRAEVRLQGKLQANRGRVTLQRRGCRSNSGLEILRRTRSFPERTNSAGSVAARLWQLGIFVNRERRRATWAATSCCATT